jgi:hypothetical protein
LTFLGIRPSKDSRISDSYAIKWDRVAETTAYLIHNSYKVESVVEQLGSLERKKLFEYMQARDNLDNPNILFHSNHNLQIVSTSLQFSVKSVLGLVENILDRFKNCHLQMIGSKYSQLQSAVNNQIDSHTALFEHHHNDYKSVLARVKTISMHLKNFESEVFGKNKMKNNVSVAITCLEDDFDKIVLPNAK